MKKILSILLLTALLLSCLPMAGLADRAAAPEDFTFDTVTGKFSFNAVDKNIGYYFVRIYSASSGVEAHEYTVSSKRLNGGKTGEIKGSVKMPSSSAASVTAIMGSSICQFGSCFCTLPKPWPGRKPCSEMGSR